MINCSCQIKYLYKTVYVPVSYKHANELRIIDCWRSGWLALKINEQNVLNFEDKNKVFGYRAASSIQKYKGTQKLS